MIKVSIKPLSHSRLMQAGFALPSCMCEHYRVDKIVSPLPRLRTWYRHLKGRRRDQQRQDKALTFGQHVMCNQEI